MSVTTISVFVLYGAVYLCLTQFVNSQNADSPCSMQSGAPGICKPNIHQCDNLWAVYEEGVVHCGPTGEMMCCPITKSVDSPCTLQSGAAGICKTSIDDCDLNEQRKEEKSTFSCGTGPEGNKMICCRKKQSISTQKCMEYSRKKCNDLEIRLEPTDIIYKGDIVDSVEEFPHMALLGYDTGRGVQWYCGGTLISEQYILTAAHCLNYNRAPVSHVNLGFLKRSNKTVDTLQEFRVVEYKKHPNRTAALRYNDVALLKLDRPVNLTPAVFPACLHEDMDIPARAVQAVGWGITEESKLSEELRKVYLTLINQSNCNTHYMKEKNLPNGILQDIQFCAGTNNKDTCNGDSGGPALIRHNDGCINSVVGITSIGFACAINKGQTPSIFSRVSYFVPWIESIVWPNQ